MAKRLRRIADGSQGEQISPRLLEIARNILTPRDVRTKPNFWKSEVVIFTEWDKVKGWTENKTFLPSAEDWEEIKKVVVKRLEKSKVTPCYFLRATNDIIKLALQPIDAETGKVVGINFGLPNVIIFQKGSKKNTWEKHADMYRVIDSDWIDTKRYIVALICKRDNTWLYHGNVLSSPGRARMHRSQLLRYKYDQNNPENDEEYPDVCFQFCGDLRRPKYSPPIVEDSDTPGVNNGTPADEEWHPKFRILVSNIDTEFAKGKFKVDAGKPEGCNEEIPQTALLKNITERDLTGSLGDLNDLHFFLFPAEVKKMETNDYFFTYVMHDKMRNGVENSNSSGYENAFRAWLPGAFNEQPHLIASEHSSVQFFFQRKLINSAKLNQVKISHKDENGELKDEVKERKEEQNLEQLNMPCYTELEQERQ